MADVTERMLALLATLQTRRAFTGDELASRLGVSPRTVRRDISRLRGYGYPVTTQPGPGGFYRLTAGTTMPPLVLDDVEAIVMMLALGTLAAVDTSDGDDIHAAATRAYGKLDQLMPPRLRPQVVAIRSSLESARPTAPPVASRALGELATSISNHQVIAFTYRAATGTATRRVCEPHRLVHLNLRWYLYAWDGEREDWRVFRVDRISDLTATGARFAPRPLPAEGVVRHLREGMGRDRQLVELAVEATADRVADALRHQDAELHPLAQNRTLVRLRLDSWQWLLLNLAFLDADFTIQGPPDFIAACAMFAARLRHATALSTPPARTPASADPHPHV